MPCLVLIAACGPPIPQHPGPPRLEHLSGEIAGADGRPPASALAEGARLVVTPEGQKPISIALAPGWYLDAQGLKLVPDAQVRLEGVRIEKDGEEVFVVRRVQAVGKDIRLRDEQGRELWKKGAE